MACVGEWRPGPAQGLAVAVTALSVWSLYPLSVATLWQCWLGQLLEESTRSGGSTFLELQLATFC